MDSFYGKAYGGSGMEHKDIKRFIHPCATIERISECLKEKYGVTDRHIARLLCDYQRDHEIYARGGCVLFMDIVYLEGLTKSKRGTFVVQEAFR